MAQARGLSVFTIAPGSSFLFTFADRLLAGDLVPSIGPAADPLSLSAATIYVPSRRSARALEEVLARRAGKGALLLPRILPLGDPAEIEERLPGFEMAEPPPLPEAVTDLDRRLQLMKLIDLWRRQLDLAQLGLAEGEVFQVARSRLDAFALAGDLAALIDEMIIERADWGKVKTLVDLEHDRFWSITAQFLGIAGGYWPAELKDRNLIDTASRRQQLIEAETKRLLKGSGETILIAGSTGSQPATAELMRAVAALPNGAVVLPGLDQNVLDDAAWGAITTEGEAMALGLTHPQAGLKRLLGRLGIERQTVIELGVATARSRIIAEALRPAATTDAWRDSLAAADSAALDGVSLVEAADERQEALAIAIAMRGHLETDAGVIALVTPDRKLAAHVIIELKRWGISAQDSAGRALPLTPAGSFARLTLDAPLEGWSGLPLLALLRDPLLRLGLSEDEVAAHTDAIETALLRGHRRIGGLGPLIAACRDLDEDRHASPPVTRSGKRLKHARGMLERLSAAFAGAEGERTLAEWAGWHRAAMKACLASDLPDLADIDGGSALSEVLDALLAARSTELVPLTVYRDFLIALMEGETVVDAQPVNSRIKILGPLEARLIPADVMILGGLNEGVWPPTARSDAFLNRRMRAELGLSPPERRVGQSAHDFTMLAGAPELILTRARRAGESPALRSRFLERLRAFTGEAVFKTLLSRGAPLLELASRLDKPESVTLIEPPCPCPPLDRRPASLSITDIERLIRDPYAIYAAKILRLQPLEEIDVAPDARLKGEIFHAALENVMRRHPASWPPSASDEIIAEGEKLINALVPDAATRAFWRSQITAIAQFIDGFERERRASGLTAAVEVSGHVEWPTPRGAFRLRGRVDRIDRLSDGSLAIIDYKTGTPPSNPQVLSGLAPQLLLAGVLAKSGGLPDIPKESAIRALIYLKLGRDSEERRVKDGRKAIDPDAMIAALWPKIREYIGRFDRPAHAYESRRMPAMTNYAGDYDHLARVKEWAAIDREAGESE